MFRPYTSTRSITARFFGDGEDAVGRWQAAVEEGFEFVMDGELDFMLG